MLANADQVYGCILVSPRNRYLLVQGCTTKKWSFPKGHPNPGETEMDCAHRELKEETGISLPLLYSDEYKLSTGTYFLYKTRGEFNTNVQNSSEISDTCWFSIAEIRKLMVNIDVSTFLRLLRKSTNDKFWRSTFYLTQ
jgi:8-oxo-dGTP pyrophosphatase MutT (NUDIX family)